jgi:hypothetical protein
MAAQVDIGSRDQQMVDVVQEIRDELLEMAGVSQAWRSPLCSPQPRHATPHFP